VTDTEGSETAVERPETSAEDVEAMLHAENLAQERQANRQGPSHPLHWQHAEWLAERGLDESWDQRNVG
jgi:hypothetical protein